MKTIRYRENKRICRIEMAEIYDEMAVLFEDGQENRRTEYDNG